MLDGFRKERKCRIAILKCQLEQERAIVKVKHFFRCSSISPRRITPWIENALCSLWSNIEWVPMCGGCCTHFGTDYSSARDREDTTDANAQSMTLSSNRRRLHAIYYLFMMTLYDCISGGGFWKRLAWFQCDTGAGCQTIIGLLIAQYLVAQDQYLVAQDGRNLEMPSGTTSAIAIPGIWCRCSLRHTCPNTLIVGCTSTLRPNISSPGATKVAGPGNANVSWNWNNFGHWTKHSSLERVFLKMWRLSSTWAEW